MTEWEVQAQQTREYLSRECAIGSDHWSETSILLHLLHTAPQCTCRACAAALHRCTHASDLPRLAGALLSSSSSGRDTQSGHHHPPKKVLPQSRTRTFGRFSVMRATPLSFTSMVICSKPAPVLSVRRHTAAVGRRTLERSMLVGKGRRIQEIGFMASSLSS